MSLNPTDALKLASEAYLASNTYFDNSIRRQVEGDLRRFQGLHPNGSKYLAEANRSRSSLFRPKTRTAIRKSEAIAAEAFFSTRDVVAIEPQDDNNPVQQASAAVMKELLQHRLTKTIPWFQTVLGAYQDALTVGLVCSYQYWKYNEAKGIDEPCIRLTPIENMRFDSGADWMDPVNTSPYLIELIPMYVKDVRTRITTIDKKTGEPKWKNISEEKLLSAVRGYSDSTRLTREQGRQDPKDQTQGITAYSIVWVHKNIVEHDGEDYCFYTLGTLELLSDPVPLAERYHHGKRPYVIGCSVIETHKNYPAGPNRLGKDVQAEINDVANLRIENVKLVLNKRYFAKRNKQVDLRSLTRNVPGSVTLMTDVDDVVAQEFNDVTASSYKEQEVLNLDFDDVTGSFSGSSVQSNRKLNETVGGMELLHTDANQVSGYQLRTFVETWAEPVLRQLVLLEQAYETDEVILALAGQKANVMEQFGIDAITDELLEQELTLSVGVGMGATNPQEKVNRFLTAMRALKELLIDGALQQHGLKFEEVCKEVFGNLGYRDGSRFFSSEEGEDPEVTQLKQMVAELQAQVAQKVPPELIDAQVRKIDAEIAALEPKNRLTQAQAVKAGVETAFSAMQGAEIIAAVPEVAPIADIIMQSQGYQLPTPAGVDPNFPQPAAPVSAAATLAPPAMKGKPPTGGAAGDTSPNTPATAGTGAQQGIETQEADSVGVEGMADGGMVGYGDALEEQKRLALQNRINNPEAYGARANTGMTINGFTDQTNMSIGVNPLTLGRMTNAENQRFATQSIQQAALNSMDAGPAPLSPAFDAPQQRRGRRDPLELANLAGINYLADGGLIQGPGTGTSDSIPAVNVDTGQPLAVSTGEFAVPPQVVEALGADFFEALIAKYHAPVEGQPAIYSGAAPIGMETGQMVIPADVVEALGIDFFEQLVQKYSQ